MAVQGCSGKVASASQSSEQLIVERQATPRVEPHWNAVQIYMGKVNAWRPELEGKFSKKGQCHRVELHLSFISS